MPDTPTGDSGQERRRVADYRLEQVEKGLSDLRREVNEGIHTLRSDVANLQFVRLDVYELHRSALAEAVVDARADAERALKHAKAEADKDVKAARAIAETALRDARVAVGVLTSAVIVAIITAAVRIMGLG